MSDEAYCKQTVLSSHPFCDVRIGAGIPALGAFGGWEMSAKQYANFISTHYRKLSPAAAAFMQASYSAGYGLGVQLRKTKTGRNIWHFGNWEPGTTTNPSQFSSHFALWDNGGLVVTLLDKSATKAQQSALDTAISGTLSFPAV